MKRAFLPYLFALLAILTEAPAFAASTEQNIPELKTVFSSEIMAPYRGIRELFFSEDGTTFLLGSQYNGAMLFQTSGFPMLEKYHVCGNQPACKDKATIYGLGYIDANTWYIAAEAWPYMENGQPGTPDGKIVIRIRTIYPPQEAASYSFPSDSCERTVNERYVFANKDHIACSGLMINWHTGEKYKVKSTVPVFGIVLTKDSRVITFGRTSHLFYFSNYYIMDNPLTGEPVWVDSLDDPTDRYRVVRSWWGCTLVSVPDKKEIGSCGTLPLFGDDNFHIAFSASQKLLAAVIADKARVFQIEPFKQLSEFPIFKKVGAIVISENAWVAADDGNGLLRVWNSRGKAVGQYAFGEKKYLRDGLATPPFAFQPGGNKLAVVQVSGVRVFELPAPSAER